ncbi:MAG: hypothetical protein AAF706_02780 [Bacteroidota bacterium]
MKIHNNKRPYIMGLLLLIGSLVGTKSHAQITTEEEEDSLQICGSGNVGVGYNIMNYQAKAFAPGRIMMQPSAGLTSRTVWTASSTLGVRKAITDHQLHLAADLALDLQDGVKLNKMYAEFKNLLVGFHASSFGSADVTPKTLAGRPSSAVGSKALQFRLKYAITESLTWSLGIEQAAKFELGDAKKNPTVASDKRFLHDIPAGIINLRYDYPEAMGHLHISGLGSMAQYYNTTEDKSYLKPAFGVNVGSALQIVEDMTGLKAQFVYGQGIGKYIADLAGLEAEVNTVYFKPNTTTLSTINAWGGCIALEHRWMPELRSTLAGSMLQVIDTKERAGLDPYKQCYKMGLSGSVSLSYHPTEQLYFGGEYLHGYKTTLDGSKKHGNSFQIVSGFTF